VKQRLVWILVALWCTTALVVAAYVRFQWIEAPSLASRCDQGAADFVCTLRAWVIQAFIHQRLGWAAVALALIAFALRSVWTAGIALFLACSGLVLYSTELCSPAALLAALVFANFGQTDKPGAIAVNAKTKNIAP
jgi:hypothetical protein